MIQVNQKRMRRSRTRPAACRTDVAFARRCIEDVQDRGESNALPLYPLCTATHRRFGRRREFGAADANQREMFCNVAGMQRFRQLSSRASCVRCRTDGTTHRAHELLAGLLRCGVDPDQCAAFAIGLDSIHHSWGSINMTAHVSSRRRFLVHAALAAASLPIAMRLIADAHAGGLPKLPLDNPQAKALGYVEDASTTKHASYKPGSACANCQFFTAATGACSLFAGFSVPPKGWCSAWSKKQA